MSRPDAIHVGLQTDLRKIFAPSKLADIDELFPDPSSNKPVEPTTLQRRVAILQARGVPMIPLKPRGKHPCTPHAAKDASADPIQIAQWVEQYSPESNVGAVAQFDGCWFLDDDTGTLAAQYKADTGQDLPYTFRVRTSRGCHYYFRHDEASRLVRYGGKENSQVIAIPGYKGEARCNNQYVVGPGSVHPSGATYEIADDVPIVAAPVELLEWLQKAYALSESIKVKKEKKVVKQHKGIETGFRKLFDAAAYRPLERRMNVSALEPGKTVPCPLPQHQHADFTPCFGPLPGSPGLLHCLGNCGWSGDMVAACYHLDGGAAKYRNMYDCARAICEEEGLNFEDYFPPTPAEVAPEPQTAHGVEPATLPPDFQPSYDTRKELQFHLPPSDNHSIGDFIIAPATGQSDGWFPLGSLSLAGGSSGSSKTTAVYQMLIDQRMKLMFLDHMTFGRSFIVVGVDRGDDSHARTMKRMRLGLETIPFYPVSDRIFDTAVAQAILDVIEKQNPLPEIVFVEGVDMMVTKPSDIHCVSAFAHDLSAIARHYHIAIIGSGGAPKMKEGQKYTLARDCFFGSVAWGRTTETLLTMTKIEKHKGRRQLHVELRNAPDEDFIMEFKDGLLVQIADEPESESGIFDDSQLDIDWYKEQARLAEKDSAKKWWTVLDFARGRCISESTALRRAKHDLVKGHINEKPGKKGRSGARLFCWVERDSNPIWKREHEQQLEEQQVAF
jgi:hypothetical protein